MQGVHPLVNGVHPDSESPAPKVDKLSRESKQIPKVDQEAERLYKMYPSKTSVRPIVRKSRADIKTISKLLQEGYPIERAIKEIALTTDYPKDLKSFLHKSNLPDMDEVDRAPISGEIGACKHEIDWKHPKLRKVGNMYYGPCIHCGRGTQHEAAEK